MQRAYSPVNSDSDSDNDEDHNDATPVRRFRLTRDGHAQALPAPSSPTSPSRSGGGQDDLDRAMREFYATPTRPLSNTTSATFQTATAAANAHVEPNIASPLPQRHGSVSSSEHSSIHSRPSSSQHTFVEETTNTVPPWVNPPQTPQHQLPQIPQQFQHAQSHSMQYPHLAQQQQQPQHAHTLPPIPSASPLYPQHTFSTFARPFSSASGPQIVPVQPWIDSRASSAFAPNSAYGHPFANAHLALGQVQPTNQRNSYLSHSQAHSTSADESEEEVEDELHVEEFHGQNGEKPFGGWDASKANIPPSGDVFATPQPETLHYGPAPVGRQVRRRMTKKKIPLTQGHLVLDLPVPSK